MELRHDLHASCEREGDGVQAHYIAAPLHSPASLCCLTSSPQQTTASINAKMNVVLGRGLHASCEREGSGVHVHYIATPLHSPASRCCPAMEPTSTTDT